MFTLAADNRVIKYFKREDAQYMFNAHNQTYSISTDWTRKYYCGLIIDCHYVQGCVDMSVSRYIVEALRKFQHKPSNHPQHAPHKWTTPVYGQKVQYTIPPLS